MPKTRFQHMLGFLALVGAVQGVQTPDAPTCSTQAWVRAPDLTPNAIIHGDTRVKISAECPDIDSVLLGLRFKERSFVKALRSREDLKLLNPEFPKFDFSNVESPWARMPSRFANRSVEDAYEKVLTNKDLWIVEEEERVVFETTEPINLGSGNYGTLRDVVQDFSILIPSTNFPPALDPRSAQLSRNPGDGEFSQAEWIYEYFARIYFTDGTTKDISAGITAFQPIYDPYHTFDGLPPATAGLKTFYPMNEDLVKNSPVANYSVEISADSGLTFFAGKKNHVVTAVITRTGLARTFSAPLNVSACVVQETASKWAAEHGMSNANAGFTHGAASVLRATSDDSSQSFGWKISCQDDQKVAVIMPNSTSEEIQANETVTTSAAFTLSIDVADGHVTTFETFYQTLANALLVVLDTPCAEGELVDLDGPYGEPDFGWAPTFEDDEEAWVPWEAKTKWCRTMWKQYSGHIPAVVHSSKERALSRSCPHAGTDTSGQVVLSDEKGCEQSSLTHYLADGARGPIFVDRNTLPELLAEDPAERQLRAPILEPVVSSPPKGEEVVFRYYRPRMKCNESHIYVGKTWAKKVAPKKNVSSAA